MHPEQDHQLEFVIQETAATEIVGLLIIAIDQGKPYFLLSPKKEQYIWTLVGGKTNPGEELRMATAREFSEETGRERLFYDGEYIYEDPLLATQNPITFYHDGTKYEMQMYMTFFYDKSTLFLNPESNKHLGWQWCSMQKLLTLVTTGKLNSALIDDFWLEIVQEVIETSNVEESEDQHVYPSPSWILEE